MTSSAESPPSGSSAPSTASGTVLGADREPPSPQDAALGPWIGPDGPGLGELCARVLAFPGLLRRQRAFVTTGVRRDLGARLSGTWLGRLWPLLQPLLLFAAYGFVFTQLLGFKIGGLPEGQESAFGVYLFLGVVVWSAFAGALGRATHALVENGNLIGKLPFPAELLVVQLAASELLLQLVALAAFVVVAWLTPVWSAPAAGLALVPLLLVLQTALMIGLGLTLAVLHVLVRDTAHVVTVLLTVWMLATPIFWVPSPQFLPGIERWLPLVEANPAHHLVYAWRVALMGGEPASVLGASPWPSIGVLAVWAVASLALGLFVFYAARRRVADLV